MKGWDTVSEIKRRIEAGHSLSAVAREPPLSAYQ